MYVVRGNARGAWKSGSVEVGRNMTLGFAARTEAVMRAKCDGEAR